MGYDLDRFVSPVNEGLVCCVCRDVLEDPLQAPCEHAYCDACIRGWLVHENTCPEDRRPLSIPQLRPVFRYMKNDLNKLQIRCRYAHAGCSVVCDLEFVRRHEETCDYDTQTCPSVGCNVTVERRDLGAHLLICDFRHQECSNGCGLSVLTTEERKHNCVVELRSAIELLRSEMALKMEEQREQAEVRLDAQRRYMVQKTSALEDTVERLKLQLSRFEGEIERLQHSERCRNEELERISLEKRELLEVIKTIQIETKQTEPMSVNGKDCRSCKRS